MKNNNKKIFTFLIFARFFDLLTTYISHNGNLKNELNILVRIFNQGWCMLILSDVILIFVAYFLLKFQTDLFYIESEKKIKLDSTFSEYLGFIYFGKKISFLKSLCSAINFKILFNSIIPILFLCTIIVSFLIGINNLLAGNGCFNLFSISKYFFEKNIDFLQENIVKLLNFIVFILITVFYHKIRYNKYINFQI